MRQPVFYPMSDLTEMLNCTEEDIHKGLRQIDAKPLMLNREAFIRREDVNGLVEWLYKAEFRQTKLRCKEDKASCREWLRQLHSAKPKQTFFGNIDLFSEDLVGVVSDITHWKEGLGRAVVFKAIYPRHETRLFLFGKTQPIVLSLIAFCCKGSNVSLTVLTS
jgi:hypothetical protein